MLMERYSLEQATSERQQTMVREAAQLCAGSAVSVPSFRERVAAAIIALALWIAPSA